MQFPSPHDHVLPHKIPSVPPPSFSQNCDEDRYIGSLVGLAVGDALGASVEFRPHQYFVEHPVRDMQGGGTWGLKAGQWTDDTSMALCLAASLITKHGYNPYDQMVRYKWWYKHGYLSSTGQCFDIGNATRDSLEEFVRRQKSLIKHFQYKKDDPDNLSWNEIQSVEAFDINCSTSGVAGNGALMRLAPVPLFFHRYPELAVEYAGRSARLTHGDQKAVDACRYYAALIVAAIQGEPKATLLNENFYETYRQWFGSVELHQDVLRVAHGSYKNPKGYEGGIRGKGYIVNALEAALWAFWSENESFEKGALTAVNLGDDTDTTAAIYGQLAGAFYGYRSIPKKWLENLYARNLLVCIGQWLYFEGEQYKPTEQDRKMTSSVQSPSVTSLSPYQKTQISQASIHLSGVDTPLTNRLGVTQLPNNQRDTRELPVSYSNFSQTQTHQPKDRQVLSRQSDTYREVDDQSYTSRSRTDQRNTYHAVDDQSYTSRPRTDQRNTYHAVDDQSYTSRPRTDQRNTYHAVDDQSYTSRPRTDQRNTYHAVDDQSYTSRARTDQRNTYHEPNYQPYINQSSARYQAEQQLSAYQPSGSNTSARRTSSGNRFENNTRYDNTTERTRQFMSPNNNLSSNEGNRRNTREMNLFNSSGPMHSSNHLHSGASFYNGYGQPALNSRQTTITYPSRSEDYTVNSRFDSYY